MKLFPYVEKCYTVIFHLTLAFMLFDWVLPLPRIGGVLGIYEILYLLLAISFAAVLLKNRKEVIPLFRDLLKSSRILFIVFALYLIMGIITVFYAKDPAFVIPRYFVAVQMAGFLHFGLLYIFYIQAESKSAIKKIFTNIGISALVIVLCSIIGYELNIATQYYDKISPYRDYNQYAIILLIGYISLTIPLVLSEFVQWKKIGALTLILPTFFSAIYASGSRRAYLMLIGLTTAIFVIAAIVQIVNYQKKNKRSLGIVSLLIFIAVISVSIFATNTMSLHISNVNELRLTQEEPRKAAEATEEDTQQETVPPKHQPPAENQLENRYQTINSGTALSKRESIWIASINKIKETDSPEIIFGYGASYSSDLYDEKDNKDVIAVYRSYDPDTISFEKHWMNPHNIFLQDILEGGIILLSLQLAFILTFLIHIIKSIKKDPIPGTTLLFLMTILFLTLMLSCGMGLISNKFTWIGLLMITALNHAIKQNQPGL